MSKRIFEKSYPFGFEVNKYEGDRGYTITGNLRKEYCFINYRSNYDVEKHIQKNVNCNGIEFDSETCQFFAYAKTEKRALKFCDDIQEFLDFLNGINKLID